jgi:8-hydroxy-5-deazaflavin:NADPH oxidoreductase
MNIGIIGAGNVAKALASLFSSAGHEVLVGARQPLDEPTAERWSSGSLADACAAELVVLAVPYTAAVEVLEPLAQSLRGTIVVDATNPLQADWSPLAIPEGVSGSEVIAARLPHSKVVKAFNTVFADIMSPKGLDRRGHPATAFLAGDDEDACAAVSDVARSAGLDPLVVGPLSAERYLEGMAHLNISIALRQGRGTDGAFVYL